MQSSEASGKLAGKPDFKGPFLRLVDFMDRDPVTVPPDATIATALQAMADNKIGSVIVTDAASGKPVGIFTLRDVLCRVTIPALGLDEPIETVMTPNPIAISSNFAVGQVAREMARLGLRHLLVTGQDGALTGIVSRTDIFHWMCDSCASIRRAKASRGEAGKQGRSVVIHPVVS